MESEGAELTETEQSGGARCGVLQAGGVGEGGQTAQTTAVRYLSPGDVMRSMVTVANSAILHI